MINIFFLSPSKAKLLKYNPKEVLQGHIGLGAEDLFFQSEDHFGICNTSSCVKSY